MRRFQALFVRFAILVTATAVLAGVSPTVWSADPPVQVTGSGQALVTDESGLDYAASFALNGVLDPNGGAHGSLNVFFGSDFGAVWGVYPEQTDAIHVWGEVTAASVAADGTVTLQGVVTEMDFGHGGGKIFEIAGDPFTAVVAPGETTFLFTWCELPDFWVEVTAGTLGIQ